MASEFVKKWYRIWEKMFWKLKKMVCTIRLLAAGCFWLPAGSPETVRKRSRNGPETVRNLLGQPLALRGPQGPTADGAATAAGNGKKMVWDMEKNGFGNCEKMVLEMVKKWPGNGKQMTGKKIQKK